MSGNLWQPVAGCGGLWRAVARESWPLKKNGDWWMVDGGLVDGGLVDGDWWIG